MTDLQDIQELQKIDYVRKQIGVFNDFPVQGIVYRDIFKALTDSKVCAYLKEVMVNYVRKQHPDVDMIVGLDARGFLFSMMIACELGIGCAPVRKMGKLPGECISVEYTLEYGSNVFEMQKSAIKPGQKVILVDDLLATGGSLAAAEQLILKTGGSVLGCLVVMELEFLNGRDKLNYPVHSLIKYKQT